MFSKSDAVLLTAIASFQGYTTRPGVFGHVESSIRLRLVRDQLTLFSDMTDRLSLFDCANRLYQCVPCVDRYSMPSGSRTRNSMVDVFCSALREINKIKLLVSLQRSHSQNFRHTCVL